MSPKIATNASLKYNEENVPYVDLGNGLIIKLECEEPSEESLELAKNELRETPEIAEDAMEKLREIIKNEPHFHLPVDEEYMRMFLRPCKYYPEGSMKRIKNFFNLKNKYGNWCDNILPSQVRHVFENEVLRLIPLRDQHGRRILIAEVGKKWKPSQVSLEELFRAVQLLVYATMKEPKSQIHGNVIILDMEGLPISHVMQFTPSFAAMLLDYVQDCLIARLKGVHIVNNSYVFNMLFAIFKPFIREKLRKRIIFHGKDYKSLAKFIDPKVLPSKYGGELGEDCFAPGYLLADLLECYKKDFEMVNTYGYTKKSKH